LFWARSGCGILNEAPIFGRHTSNLPAPLIGARKISKSRALGAIRATVVSGLRDHLSCKISGPGQSPTVLDPLSLPLQDQELLFALPAMGSRSGGRRSIRPGSNTYCEIFAGFSFICSSSFGLMIAPISRIGKCVADARL
jgi:hypothetical protein